MPAALDRNWDAIRAEFAHGVGLEALALKYNVKPGTLFARSAREKWMETRPETHVRPLQEALVLAAKAQGMTLAERGLAYAERQFDRTSKVMDEIPVPRPKNIKDYEVLDRVVRRAAGLDNIDTQVNTIIGIAGFDDGPVLEAKVVTNESLPD